MTKSSYEVGFSMGSLLHRTTPEDSMCTKEYLLWSKLFSYACGRQWKSVILLRVRRTNKFGTMSKLIA